MCFINDLVVVLHIMLIWVTAIALSLDGFVAGISLGLRKTRIPMKAKLIIALLSCLFAMLSIFTGHTMSLYVNPYFGKWLGGGILFFLGFLVVYHAVRQKKQDGFSTPIKQPVLDPNQPFHSLTVQVFCEPCQSDLNGSGKIELKEALLLGFSLSLDMLGAGIALTISGMDLYCFPFAIGIIQPIFLTLGENIGHRITEFGISKQIISWLSGIILMGLAITRIFV